MCMGVGGAELRARVQEARCCELKLQERNCFNAEAATRYAPNAA